MDLVSCTCEKEKACIYYVILVNWPAVLSCLLFRNRGWQEFQDHQEPFHHLTPLVVLPQGWDQIRAQVHHQDMQAISSRQPWWNRWWQWSRRRGYRCTCWSSRNFSESSGNSSSSSSFWLSRYAFFVRAWAAYTGFFFSCSQKHKNAITHIAGVLAGSNPRGLEVTRLRSFWSCACQ